jgi:Mlc titration factor MtfA (ptsG expression regulator)
VRVTIAAQACLLILNRKPDYFPNLHQILVYPGAFIVERFQPWPTIPCCSRTPRRRSRENRGRTARRDLVGRRARGRGDPDDGRNVVIHEFAHQLDQHKGYANGAPWLGSRHRYPRWSQVLGEEYARLHQSILAGVPSLFSPYAATNPPNSSR